MNSEPVFETSCYVSGIVCGICRRCSSEQDKRASNLLGASSLFSLLVKIKEPKMMKWKGIVYTSRRPNLLHLTGIP